MKLLNLKILTISAVLLESMAWGSNIMQPYRSLSLKCSNLFYSKILAFAICN